MTIRDRFKHSPLWPVLRRVRTAIAHTGPKNTSRDSCIITDNGSGNTVTLPHEPSASELSITINGDDNTIVVDPDTTVSDSLVTIAGSGNVLRIGRAAVLDLRVAIAGSGNQIEVEDGCTLRSVAMVCEDAGNLIRIGESTEIAGSTEFAAIEGTSIRVGPRCLFSSGIDIRTGDSHSITDRAGKRINHSTDVTIGEHVWIGRGVTVLKGASIPESCVVGAASVVTAAFDEPNCIVAGNPARVVRRDIDWTVERPSQE